MAASPTRKKFPTEKKPKEKPLADRMKKTGDEIDELFRGKKAKKRKEEDQHNPLDGGSKPTKKPKKIRENEEVKKKNKGAVVGETHVGRARRRRTADGLTVYSAEELGVGNQDAGGTPLCPFDCSCCF